MSVLVAAGEQDQKFRTALREAMSSFFSVIHMDSGKMSVPNQPAEYVLCDLNSFRHIESNKAILLFKDTCPDVEELSSATQTYAVVDSAKENLLRFVSGTRLPAITCGLSPRDTLNLTSITDDSAVINLQRSVNCFDGSVADPQEIPVKLRKPMDSFTLMCLASVFILSGKIDALFQAEF